MNQIYLPNLKRIQIHDYNLYPNGLDFEFDFVKGVNLIIGGNGMGKTTFVNIIKFAIIGHYKKDLDFTRTYKERDITRRSLYPRDYYRNRMDNTIKSADQPTVSIEFKINKDTFKVCRALDDVSLLSFSKNNKEFSGIVLNQFKYDELFNAVIREHNNGKREVLQQLLDQKLLYIYEKEIEKSLNRSFDDLIFFVNEILFFGEEHKTILWNNGSQGVDVQSELFNKYFNEPELDAQRKEAQRQAKYYNSISRHKSEDIRAIKIVLEKINKKNDTDQVKSMNEQILDLRADVENCDTLLNKIQHERQNLESEISLLNNVVNTNSEEVNITERNRKIAETKMFESKWVTLHKSYEVYFQNIKVNSTCPMCSQDLTESFVDQRLSHADNCFLCGQEIVEIQNEDSENLFRNYNEKLKSLYTIISNAQVQISEKEKLLIQADKQFRSTLIEKNKLQSELRKLEFANSQENNQNEDNLQAFYDEIASLEKEKAEFQEKSRIEKEREEQISLRIEEAIVENTSKFSILFSGFAKEFLGVECSLTYTDLNSEGKRFYPVIDGKIRINEEELSESQRFFVDHSFRMSILSFFYNKPTFYIVETPDSSLDISYEENAANVFIKFLEKPNSLILTTNLNNSDFLTLLIDNAQNVSVINLLEIGKKSAIQSTSRSLMNLYNRVKQQISNER